MSFLIDPNLAFARVILGAVAVGTSLIALFVYAGDMDWASTMTNGQSYLRQMALAQIVRELFRFVKQILLTAIAVISLWIATSNQDGFTGVRQWSDIGAVLQILVLFLFLSTTFLDLITRRSIQRGAERNERHP